MRCEIRGVERRRWSDEDKLSIVLSVGIDEATVMQVAQHQEITRQQIYAWRHDLKKKGLCSPDAGALFFPLEMPVADGALVAQPPAVEPPQPTEVKLCLRGGRCLHFDSAIAPATLTSRIRTVDAA